MFHFWEEISVEKLHRLPQQKLIYTSTGVGQSPHLLKMCTASRAMDLRRIVNNQHQNYGLKKT